MHNLQLTEDQDLIVDTVKKFVAEAVAPGVLELDEHRTYAGEWLAGLAELGLFGLCVAEDNGGVGMGFLPLVAALEAIGEQSASLARLWIGQAQAAAALEAVGDERLGDVVGGAATATYIGPECGVTFADGKLHGKVELVVAGAQAQLFVLAVQTAGGPAVAVVDAGAVQRTELRQLGLASAACARVSFDGVGAAAVTEGAAAGIAKAALIAQIGSAATAVGGGRAAIAAARRHASERIAFGKPLLAQQAVSDKLVESTRQVEAARHLAWHAARVADLGEDASDAAMLAKLTAVDAMTYAADEAIQIHGGFGYTVEYHVERHYRDAKTLEVLDGGHGALRAALAAKQFAC
jgi:alkylation response protein AidB-like acyl-CoA dehydrogenase